MADRPVIWDYQNANHRMAFATALAPIVNTLWKRKENFSKQDAVIYMRVLKFVPSAILVEAVDEMLSAEKWFPEPSTVLKYCADIVDAKRKEACKRWLGTDCEDCHGSRWREIDVDGVSRLERCGCWKRAMLEMDQIGQPLPRPALPAHVEPPNEL